MNADCTILVTSCDRYRDVEGPFLTLFRRYWPDCPFELVVNGETGAADGFDRVILSGKGKCWSQMLVEALDAITTPYVILLMNDYYLEAPVETAKILRYLALARQTDALNLRLNPNPPGRAPFAAEGAALRVYPKNTAYAVSCQTGIWNRAFLRDLVARTKSAWEFERRGSFLFDAADSRPLLVTEKKEFPFLDVVHKGYWEPWGVKLLRREKISYDFSVRTAPPLKIRLVESLKSLIFALFPWTLIVRLQNAFDLGAKELPVTTSH